MPKPIDPEDTRTLTLNGHTVRYRFGDAYIMRGLLRAVDANGMIQARDAARWMPRANPALHVTMRLADALAVYDATIVKPPAPRP